MMLGLVRTIRVVSMHPVAGLVQCVNSMAMAADDSLLRARPSKGAVLCLHKAHPQALRCIGDEAPQVGQLIRFIHVCDACQVQPPHQLPESRLGQNQDATRNIYAHRDA